MSSVNYLRQFVIVIITMVLLSVWLQAEESGQVTDGAAKYEVIAQRNIFSKNRTAKRVRRGDAPARVEKRKVVVELYVLRGIGIFGGAKTAFIEEQISGRFIRSQVDSEIASGLVKKIESNKVVFDKDGTAIDVFIGGTFPEKASYKEFAVDEDAEDVTETASSSGRITDGDSGGGGGSQSDILKKLKEQRKAELSN